MSWRFWEPRHSVGSVAERLASGLRKGSIVLGEPFEQEDETPVKDEVVLQLDLPEGISDAEILEMVKQCLLVADQNDRRQGGNGLRLNKVMINSPGIRVALRSRGPAALQD